MSGLGHLMGRLICNECKGVETKVFSRGFPVVPETGRPHDLSILWKEADKSLLILMLYPFKKADKRKESMLFGEKLAPGLTILQGIHPGVKDIELGGDLFFGVLWSHPVAHAFEDPSAIFMDHDPSEIAGKNAVIFAGFFEKVRPGLPRKIQGLFKKI